MKHSYDRQSGMPWIMKYWTSRNQAIDDTYVSSYGSHRKKNLKKRRGASCHSLVIKTLKTV